MPMVTLGRSFVPVRPLSHTEDARVFALDVLFRRAARVCSAAYGWGRGNELRKNYPWQTLLFHKRLSIIDLEVNEP